MNTEKLLHVIAQSTSISEALCYVEQEERLTPLNKLLYRVMEAQELSPQQLAKLIDVERTTLYRLLSGERLTTRNVLMRIALALRMTLHDTQALLRSGQRAELYVLVRRDALLIYCIGHGFTLEQTETELARKGETSLFERI